MMGYWRRLDELLKNAELKTDEFNLDIDGLNKKAVTSLARGLKKIDFVSEITSKRNIRKYKHYHLHVKLNKPIEYWKICLLRIFFNDDCIRMRFDLVRLNKGVFDTFGYIGDKKYSYDTASEETEIHSEYLLCPLRI